MKLGTIKKVATWGIVVGGIALLGEAIAKLKTTGQAVTPGSVVGEIKTLAGEAAAKVGV